MAVGNDYPADIIDANGNVSQGITIRFLDSTNQPVPPGDGMIAVSQIDADGITDDFVVTAESDVAVWQAP